MLCQIRRHHIEGIPGKRSGHTLERPDHEGDAALPLMTARHEAPAGQGGQPERDKAQSPVRLCPTHDSANTTARVRSQSEASTWT